MAAAESRFPLARLAQPALLALLAVAAAGCAAFSPVHRQASELNRQLRDRGLDPAAIVIPWQLDPAMREWAHQHVAARVADDQRLTLLLAALLDKGKGLGLTYESGTTGTARDAFASHQANCLAFTSLFVGLARELDVPVFYLDIGDVEKFEREGSLVIESGHVTAGFDAGGKLRILDFSPADRPSYRQLRRMSDLTAIALFYSNRGAELMKVGRDREAQTWLDTAVRLDPDLARAWTNRGVAQRHNGDLAGAEASYHRALEADASAVAAYEDLAVLLFATGRHAEGEELMSLSGRLDTRNPWNQLALGDMAAVHGRVDEARRFYRRAERVDAAAAEAEAALGELALAAGDRGEAHRWLRKARARDGANERVRRLAARLDGGEGGVSSATAAQAAGHSGNPTV
jgi:tetratricopeptide (TPR) repeat protein